MKTRNLIMAAAAVLFAVAGAIASSFVATNIFVKGRVNSGDAISCIDTNQTCDALPGHICAVTITVTGPVGTGTQTAASNSLTHKTYFPDEVCQTVLTNSSDVTKSSSLRIYELD